MRGYRFSLHPKPLPLIIAANEAFGILAQRYHAVSWTTEIIPERDKAQQASLAAEIYFKTGTGLTRFKNAPFMRNFAGCFLYKIKLEEGCDSLTMLDLGFQAIEQCPQLRKEILLLPNFSEENNRFCFFAKDKHAMSGLIATIQDIAEPACGRPPINSGLMQLAHLLRL
jgi:hypothetical protein